MSDPTGSDAIHRGPALSAHLDGELDADRTASVETHLSRCRECRELVEELRAVRERAAALEDRAPERDLWPDVARRIGLAGGEEPETEAGGRRPGPDGGVIGRFWHRRISATLPQLAAAAAMLVALVVAAVLLLAPGAGDGAGPADRPIAARDTGAVPLDDGGRTEAGGAPLLAETSAAARVERPYADRIAALERRYRANRDRMDPKTLRALEASFRAIDGAIADAERALADDPGDPQLSGYLAQTLRRKVNVLKLAVALSQS